MSCTSIFAASSDLAEVRKLFTKGDYGKCITSARKALSKDAGDEELSLILAQALKTTGDYVKAGEVISTGIRSNYRSVRLRLEGHEVFKLAGNKEKSQEMLEDIGQLASSRGFREVADIVALGQGAVLLGVDARVVLENFFDAAKKLDPKYPGVYLASGTLALDKHDDGLAARTFEEGLKLAPEDPDILFGLARAYSSSDNSRTAELVESVLKINERYVPALLLMTDRAIDAEAYEQATEFIEKILEINPAHPEALAFQAVIYHLQNKPTEEAHARASALKASPGNVRVDFLLGEKLSQKYRFAEGSSYQKRALQFEPNYLPSQIQLAQDLLRLGSEEEGWSLAEKVHQADAYDVYAYNLVTLRETINSFTNISNERFLVRMSPRERSIYGGRVIQLLDRAHRTLSEKYQMPLTNQILVEVFPEQKDFAVRTFGMPGGSGYLGVCFGNVITANSPASSVGAPSNWEAMLWHEFCHVITLNLTRNRMPRWLSEGISVYEEIQSNPVWGQHMDPHYRQMIAEGELKPIGKMSAAFMSPKSGQHLQFAYYQSSLVVRFLVEKYGFPKLLAVLKDLGEGVLINPALEKHTAPLSQLEKEFDKYAHDLAEKFGPELEWEKPKPDPTWETVHPNNYWVLQKKVSKMVAKTNWAEAKPILEKMIEMYPGQGAGGNAYQLLAQSYRQAKDLPAEKKILRQWVSLSADPLEALDRLMALSVSEKDWASLSADASRFLAVNPLVVQPHEYLARALAETGRIDDAIPEYRIVLGMDPPDPALTHFSLAKLLEAKGDAEARQQVLDSLEAAPRFRDAHELLLKIQQSRAKQTEKAAPDPKL